MLLASSWNSDLLATKSVSQLTSTKIPNFPPICIYASTIPSVAMRPDFLAAVTKPFFFKASSAFAKSPLASCNAFLQSIIPADVFSLNSFTIFAEISATIFFS